MSAVPARCLHCHRDLDYDPISLRYRCPGCEAGDAGSAGGAASDAWRERGEAVGRGAARLLRWVERLVSK